MADLGRGRPDARCPVWSCSAVRWNPRLPSFAHARTWLQHRLKGVIRLRKIESCLCDVTLPKPGVRPSVREILDPPLPETKCGPVLFPPNPLVGPQPQEDAVIPDDADVQQPTHTADNSGHLPKAVTPAFLSCRPRRRPVQRSLYLKWIRSRSLPNPQNHLWKWKKAEQ